MNMNFKKYSDMELALLASIASMTTEEMENIAVEKGDVSFVSMEDYNSVPSYLHKPNAVHHAIRRKDTFRKKEEQKTLAQNLGYIMDTNTSKKVKSMLSASHSDNAYFRGNKSGKKHMTIKEEKAIMEREAVEEARDAMEKEHDGILGAIACDIDTLTLDMRDNECSIENLEKEYEALREEMELVAEKLKNAQLRKNGIQAALVQKEHEYKETSDKLMQEMHRFGW